TFEVASIKPSDRNARGMMLDLVPGGGLKGVNVRLRTLIEFAYDVDRTQLSGGPGWMESEGFDILAKGPGGEGGPTEGLARRERLDAERPRLQALLAERFGLKIRHEPKEMPVYILVMSKNGHRMRETEDRSGVRRNRGEITSKGAPLEI